MGDTTPLGHRMKQYEAVSDFRMPRRTFALLRVDIRSAHTYLKDAERPFDDRFMADMDAVAEALCREITGAVLAFTQSDEISVLAYDFASINTESWFNARVSKWISLSAARATAVLNRRRPDEPMVEFDSRVFVIPDPVEVANYFVWRQRDATRNSVSMTAQWKFTPEELHKKNSDQMQEMLFQQHGINWGNFPAAKKRGRVTFRTPDDTGKVDWRTEGAPRFTADEDGWLAAVIPARSPWSQPLRLGELAAKPGIKVEADPHDGRADRTAEHF